jgi:N-acetylglucosaminyldiphosphoundecaprenol N-acetyl-beta-D-mannosaminyltransferase
MEVKKIWGLNINNVGYEDLIYAINSAINNKSKTLITYANVNTLNSIYKNIELVTKLNRFDIIHPDGVGVYIASKYLFHSFGFKKRITGSDFYPILIKECIAKNLSVFFFGHDDKTLNKIKDHLPELLFAGMYKGYDYNDEDLLELINASNPDIQIVGISFPKQEYWILNNKDNLKCNVVLAVGDGIKVFANTKIRGPKFIQKTGFEWFIRLLTNPRKYWKRYIFGNYLFLVRIIKSKFS